VVEIGTVSAPERPLPTPADLVAIDASPVRAFHRRGRERMVAEIEAAKEDRDTLGGVVEVLAYGLPPGVGSHVHWDRRIDARLAEALMSIQAIKAVEIGDGFASAGRRGSVGPRRDPPGRDRLRPAHQPGRGDRGRDVDR
jgi:chorismate synthase